MNRRPQIVHIVHRFDFGGLENGVVNLVNGLPNACHTIIALTEASVIRERIRDKDVRVYALNKRPGTDPRAYAALYRLLRTLRPDIVHTRNYGALDCQLVATLAGVPRRIHSEH